MKKLSRFSALSVGLVVVGTLAGGLFGDEEIHIIKPAIEAARAEGIDASGP